MKARLAVPILLTCASIMVSGLGIAAAQEQPNIPPPQQQGGVPRLEPPIKQLPGGLPRRAPGLPGNQGGTGTPPGTPGDQEGTTPSTPGSPGSGDDEDFEPMAPGARVTFNLEDAELTDLVRLVSQITGKRFIITGKARSLKASVFAPTKVTAAEAYRAFLSILDLNGMTVVPSGRYLKIVDTQGIEGEPIRTYTGGSPTPGGDSYLTRLHRVENVSADDVRTLLERFKTDSASIVAYAPTNTLIITETGTNLQRMLRLIEAIDVPRTGEQVWIEPIHYANAAEIAARLTEIFPVGEGAGGGGPEVAENRPRPPRPQASPGAPAGGESAPGATVGSRSGESRVTKILPDERTNSLIILATERAYLRILELIRQLDVPLEGEGRVHVHYLQHAEAEDLANTLSSIISGGGGGGGAPRPQGGAPAGAGGGGGGGAATPGLFEGAIRVTAHKATNSLVVTSSLHDYAQLRRVIDRLDARRRQVFIEAVIMEMSVTRGTNLGISFHGGVPSFPQDDALTVIGSNARGSLNPISADALTGLALGVRGPDIEESRQLVGFSVPAFGVALNAIANSGDTNILSTPHLIAMDNEEAEISVGGNVPLQTSGLAGGAGGLSSLAGLAGGANGAGAAGLAGLAGLAGGGFGQVPRADVGTTLRITPHINESDEVRLDIEEEISEAEASTEGTLGVRSISKRSARTKLVVRDAQTVVIGGLMRDTVTTSESKIPILGDIPLLGVLFRQTTHRTEKRNLLLFLTPYIIRGPDDLRNVFERKMRERQEFIDRYFVFGDTDYEPPIDYSRTRGMVSEIINTIRDVDEEIALRVALENEPVPEHVPRPPVGAVPVVSGSGEGDVVIDESGNAITPDGQPITTPTVETAPPIDAPPPESPTDQPIVQ